MTKKKQKNEVGTLSFVKKAKFLIFLGLLILQKTFVFAGTTDISGDGINFQINNTGPSYSPNEIANGFPNYSPNYTYNGPETGGAAVPATAISYANSYSAATNLTIRYLVGNSSRVITDPQTTNASFFIFGTNVALTGPAGSAVNIVGIEAGASASVESSITVNALEIQGGTLDQRNKPSSLPISSGFSLQNATLIFPLAQSGHALSCVGNGGPFDDPPSFSVIFHNPSNAPLATGAYYHIIEGATVGGVATPASALTSVSVMDASGQVIPITSFNSTPISIGPNGNYAIRFSINPTIHKGYHHKQGGTASTYSHQYIQSIAGTALSVGREGRAGSPGYVGSFTSNPFKVPDMTDFMSITEGAQTYSARENLQRWSPLRTDKTGIWAQPFGMILREAAQQGQPGFTARTAGVLFGIDHRLRYDLILGGAVGYATTKQSIDRNGGKTSVKDRFIDLFVTWFRDAWYLDGALLLGYEHYNQSRNVGNNAFAFNRHAGFLVTPHVGGGYNFTTKFGKLGAFANFDYTYCKQFGYQETGGNVNDLYVKSSLATMIRSEVGASISQEYLCSHVNWKPKFALSLVHKTPLRKGTITATNGASFEGSSASSTNISPALYSTFIYEDGWSFSGGLIGEFGPRYNMGEAFLKFAKRLGSR